MRSPRLALAVPAVGMVLATLLAPPVAAAVPDAATRIQVGTRTLQRCQLGAGAVSYCGSIRTPLAAGDPSAGTITVGFAWIPATGRSVGTVVAEEGGPGYPSTGTAPDYVAMLGPLHRDHDLLLVDARGTGRSTLLRCLPLQRYTGSTASDHFRELVRQCADQLDHTFRRADGTWVHAADLFGTAEVARDMAAVVRALGVGRVDLYGDSYGSWFAQVFLARYPQLVRSVVLDSTYEARDLDPWYVTTVTTARAAFDTVCVLSAACAAAAPGPSWARVGELAARLRAHPVTGTTTGTDGSPVTITVGVRQLVDMVNDAGYDFGPYRTLDAAARALLEHGDAQPLLRQYAQDVGWDFGDYSGPPTVYTDGLYYAVACTDYPQLFDMHATPAARRTQLAAAVRALPADTFAPFTTQEWLQVNQYTEAYTACLGWPAPVHDDPALPPGPLDATGVPVLILNGSLDSLTPATGGAHVARQMGPAARAVVASNMVHLVALDDPYGCGASIYRRFVADPGGLATMDISCATAIPEVHTVGAYAVTLAGVVPASGPADATERRMVAVAVAAVGDAARRYGYVDAYRDRGLRGGSVGYRPEPQGLVRATLRHVRWTVDTTVDGVALVGADGLSADGTVTVTGPRGRVMVCHLDWTTTGPNTVATVQVGGLTFRLPAP
jgi:pimeloyl-ACP methyl ester carboxylesterase